MSAHRRMPHRTEAAVARGARANGATVAAPAKGRALVCLFGIVLGACSARPLEIGREPELSAVGSGLTKSPMERLAQGGEDAPAVRRNTSLSQGSTWSERGSDIFRDPRARRPGDIITVTISMKDKASFDNSSKRTRDSSHGFGVDMSHAVDWRGFASAASAKADSAVKSNSSHDGKGGIARSENIDLRIAAVVADVLPNGNLVIQGSQELRVNFELRVLTFSGIVNLADIKADNTISHERIAEARMSYGGRGRITEVQQPSWGHQIVDLLAPF